MQPGDMRSVCEYLNVVCDSRLVTLNFENSLFECLFLKEKIVLE